MTGSSIANLFTILFFKLRIQIVISLIEFGFRASELAAAHGLVVFWVNSPTL